MGTRHNSLYWYTKFAFAGLLAMVMLNGSLLWFSQTASRDPHVLRAFRVDSDGNIIFTPRNVFEPSQPVKLDLTQPILHPHDFDVLITPYRMERDHMVSETVLCVFSSVLNFGRRIRIREFWKSSVKHNPLSMDFLFFLGLEVRTTYNQVRIRKEAERHKDIVQINITDTTGNLTLKTMSLLKFATRRYPYSKFIIKMDDDIRKVSLSALVGALREQSLHLPNFVMGNSKYYVEGPIRDEASKYFVSVKDYPDKFFPIFAHGPVYGFPTQTARLLYETARRLPLFRLEDVFITGICARKANIPVLFDNAFVCEHNSSDPY